MRLSQITNKVSFVNNLQSGESLKEVTTNEEVVLLNYPSKLGLLKLNLYNDKNLILNIKIDDVEIQDSSYNILKMYGQNNSVDFQYNSNIKVEVVENPNSKVITANHTVKNVDASDEILSAILPDTDSVFTDGFVEGKHDWVVHDYISNEFENGDPVMVEGPQAVDDDGNLVFTNGDPVMVQGPQQVDEEGNLVFIDGDPIMEQGEQLRDQHGELLFERGRLLTDENGDQYYEKVPVYGPDVQSTDEEGNLLFEQIPVYEDDVQDTDDDGNLIFVQIPVMTEIQDTDENGNLIFEQIPVQVTRYKIVGYTTKEVSKTTYYSSNEAVTVNGNPTQGKIPVYSGIVTDSFSAEADIVNDNGDKQVQIDQTSLNYPPILFLPVIKILNGDITNVSNEVYMSATLVNGRLQATGKFPEAGNWVLNADRVNKSLEEIGADWKIVMEDLSFRIAEKVD